MNLTMGIRLFDQRIGLSETSKQQTFSLILQDILIQRLQELKEQQLGNLQISVPVDTMSFNKRKDEVLHDFSDLTNKSHILGSQK